MVMQFIAGPKSGASIFARIELSGASFMAKVSGRAFGNARRGRHQITRFWGRQILLSHRIQLRL